MPDVFLRSGEANPRDVRLYGPGVLASGGVALPAPALAGTAQQTDRASGGVALPAPALAGTARQTDRASGGVVIPGPALAGTATVSTVETTFCDYDYAGDTYDNPADTYDCGAVAQPPNGLGWFDRGPESRPRPTDDDEETLLVALILRRRFRL